ncbi:serine hydrolase domain-containing protein [Plantactinospora sp. B5E13]|uniref:serine hydrolase domain-containing protein n=1 Tax=unclassified Plantactinospora TaxID=2631981 RepID=UPI00325F44E7
MASVDHDRSDISLDPIPATRGLLNSWTDSGEVLGAYVFVSHHGRLVADVAIGRCSPERSSRTSDVGRLYCGVKPFVAVCLAKAVQDGMMEFGAPVREFVDVPDTGQWKSVDILSLLAHSSGLRPSHDNPYLRSFDSYVATIGRDDERPARWVGQPVYNTTDAWHLLAASVERVFRRPIDAVVEEVVAQPVGADSLCLLHPVVEDYAPLHARGPSATFREVSDAPRRELFSRVNPAHGGFSRNGDVGRFYSELLDCHAGRGVLLEARVVREMTRPHAILNEGSRQQHVWGLGFEMAVAPRYFGVGWGRRSFGHSGAVGYVTQGPPRVFLVSLADPESGLVLSLRLASIDARSGFRLASIGRSLTTDLADYLA